MDVSIIIPAHNERPHLAQTVASIRAALERGEQTWEILIVDNLSSDGTAEIAACLASVDQKIRFIECQKKGKGWAVRIGMLESRGDVAIFTDADGSSPADEIGNIYCALLDDAIVAIGTRNARASLAPPVHRPLQRRLASLTLNMFLRLLYQEHLTDFMCGLKGFRREAVPLLFRNLKIGGWAFDIEVIYLARKSALPIREVPIGWNDQPNSSVRLVKDGLAILFDATRIPWLHRRD